MIRSIDALKSTPGRIARLCHEEIMAEDDCDDEVVDFDVDQYDGMALGEEDEEEDDDDDDNRVGQYDVEEDDEEDDEEVEGGVDWEGGGILQQVRNQSGNYSVL